MSRVLARLPVVVATAGAAVGSLVAVPLEDVRSKCPPAGEGLNYCVVQKSWLPALMTVLLFALVAFVLVEFALRAPALVRAVRLERQHRRTARMPPFRTDATLVDASWGHTYDEPAKPKPVREQEAREREAAPGTGPPKDGEPVADDIEMRR